MKKLQLMLLAFCCSLLSVAQSSGDFSGLAAETGTGSNVLSLTFTRDCPYMLERRSQLRGQVQLRQRDEIVVECDVSSLVD